MECLFCRAPLFLQRYPERERKGLEPVQVDCWAVDLQEETDVCTFRCE
jgi:hypothetical protein